MKVALSILAGVYVTGAAIVGSRVQRHQLDTYGGRARSLAEGTVAGWFWPVVLFIGWMTRDDGDDPPRRGRS